MNDFDGFENYDDYDEFEDFEEYEEYQGFQLPVFDFYTTFTFYCENGYRTDNLEDAIKHGYCEGRGRSFSFGHGNAFETFDYNILPVIENFSMELEDFHYIFFIRYFKDGEYFKGHELWYTSHDVVDGKLKPLVGPASDPYEYLDQGYEVYIFERDGFVIVLSALDWENCSTEYTGFRVKAEEFYKVWNEMPFPEPYR